MGAHQSPHCAGAAFLLPEHQVLWLRGVSKQKGAADKKCWREGKLWPEQALQKLTEGNARASASGNRMQLMAAAASSLYVDLSIVQL